MADFERIKLEIGLEFVRWSSAERDNLSEDYSESKEDTKQFECGGRQPHEFLNSNYLLA